MREVSLIVLSLGSSDHTVPGVKVLSSSTAQSTPLTPAREGSSLTSWRSESLAVLFLTEVPQWDWPELWGRESKRYPSIPTLGFKHNPLLPLLW